MSVKDEDSERLDCPDDENFYDRLEHVLTYLTQLFEAAFLVEKSVCQ